MTVDSRRIHRTEGSDLSVGRALPVVSFTLDKPAVDSYMESVEDHAGLFQRNCLVPPLAIATIARKKLMEVLRIPDGAIQSQAIFDFLGGVKSGETLYCSGTISEHWMRNGVNYVAVDIQVKGMNRRCVLKGIMGFILAPTADGGA